AVRAEQTGKDGEERRFAAAGRPHQQGDLPALELEGDVGHRNGFDLSFPEGAHQIPGQEDRLFAEHYRGSFTATKSPARSAAMIAALRNRKPGPWSWLQPRRR